MKKGIVIIFSMFLLLLLSGCMPGDGANNSENLAGFFWGIWHGWIAPLSIICSFFDNEIRVYEVMNAGILYDIGFYMAIISGFGGISLSRSSKKE